MTSKELSMMKAKTIFPQVPVEVAKKVAAAESDGHASGAVKLPKKRRNGSAPADHKSVAEEDR
jgi:hypothetical protein